MWWVRAAAPLLVALGLLAGGCQTVGLSSPTVEPRQSTFEAPLNGASSVTAEFAALVSGVVIEPLAANAEQLITADIGYIGELTTTAEGEEARSLVIRDVLNSFSYNGPELTFDIRLNPTPPLNLTASTSSGPIRLNLSAFDIRGLTVATSSGSVDAQLPASSAAYTVQASSASGSIMLNAAPAAAITFSNIATASGRVTINAGDEAVLEGGTITSSSGAIELDLSAATSASFRLTTSSGAITVDVPEGAPVRLEVQANSSGSIRTPAGMTQVSGNERTGVWETANYADDAPRILIVVTATSSGSVTLR